MIFFQTQFVLQQRCVGGVQKLHKSCSAHSGELKCELQWKAHFLKCILVKVLFSTGNVYSSVPLKTLSHIEYEKCVAKRPCIVKQNAEDSRCSDDFRIQFPLNMLLVVVQSFTELHTPNIILLQLWRWSDKVYPTRASTYQILSSVPEWSKKLFNFMSL